MVAGSISDVAALAATPGSRIPKIKTMMKKTPATFNEQYEVSLDYKKPDKS